MKVAELEPGMMIETAGDSEVFLRVNTNHEKYMAYLTVRHADPRFFKSAQSHNVKIAMYLGRKKDVNVSKEEMSWSDRFVLFDNEITAVDPSAWARLKPVA